MVGRSGLQTGLSLRRPCSTSTPLIKHAGALPPTLMALSAIVNIGCQHDKLELFTSRLRAFQHHIARTAVPESLLKRASRPKFSNGGKSPMHSLTPDRCRYLGG